MSERFLIVKTTVVSALLLISVFRQSAGAGRLSKVLSLNEAIGIALGAIGTTIVSNILAWATLISIQSIAVAFFFFGAIGIFFGFHPAREAVGLNPINALRYE